MYVRGDAMKRVLSFRIFIGILSYPWEFLDFSHLIVFSTSPAVAYFSFILDQASLKFHEESVWDCYNVMKFSSILMLPVTLLATVKK